jgi:hypothetical protein
MAPRFAHSCSPASQNKFFWKKDKFCFFPSVELSLLAMYKRDFSIKTNWWSLPNCVPQLIIQEKKMEEVHRAGQDCTFILTLFYTRRLV